MLSFFDTPVSFTPMAKEDNNSTTQTEKIARTITGVKKGLPQFLGFEIFFRLLGFAIFAPITAWIATQLISSSSSGAISNYDIAGFLLSVKGVAYVTVVVTVGFALVFFEFGGLISLAAGLQKNLKIPLPRLFRFLGLSLPRLWRLSVRQFLRYLLFALPCLAVAGGAYLFFLTESDINYYLQIKPPAFWYAAGIAGVAALVFAFFAVRIFISWIYSVPILLLEERTPSEALRESERLTEGRYLQIVVVLLKWFGITVLLFVAFWGIIDLLKYFLLGLAGQKVALVLTMTSLLAVAHFLGTSVISILATSSLAYVVFHHYFKLRPQLALPEDLTGVENSLIQRASKFLKTGWVIVLGFGALTVFAALRILERIDFQDEVTITAHRGSSITAPENTLAAIMLAVEEGADFVEIDVQETKDGTVVLVHDKDLLRVFGIKKGIWELTYDELKDLDSGGWFSSDFSDQRLQTLDQVIKAVKGRAKLNIELKFNGHQEKLATEVVRIVRENNFANQCILTSLDYDGLRRAKAAGPEIRAGMIVTSALGDITKLETDLLSVSASAVTRDLIDRAHQKNLEVHVWTVNEVAPMNRLIGMGVNSIITDNPKLLGEVITERADRSHAEIILLRLAEIASQRF
jgi:glycerophosphoryl diester phosphodiesterase